MVQEKLEKTCPFCGGTAFLYRTHVGKVDYYHVECCICGGSVQTSSCKEQVVELWNRRVRTMKEELE